jgi:hypothetical protein
MSTNKVYNFFSKYPGHTKTSTREIANRLGVSYADVCDGRSLYRKRTKVTEDNDKVVYEEKVDWDNEVEKAGVSTEYEAYLKRQGINKEDVTRVYFKEKASGTFFTVETKNNSKPSINILEEIKKSFEEYIPPQRPYSFEESIDSDKICIVNAFDAHIDKISYLDTTDSENTLHSNIQNFESNFEKLLRYVELSDPELILFPIGNDFWNVNDSTMSTKKGTDQKGSTHPNFRESFREGVNLLRRCVDKLSAYAPINILFIKGNHDEDQVAYLLEIMRVAYEKDNNVSITDSFKQRQYVIYENTLIGFAHGDKENNPSDLPMRIATDSDARFYWSYVKQVVMFLGHFHFERKYKYMESADFQGVNIKFLRSSEGSEDTWHWDKGYNGGLKTIYCFVYDKEGKEEQEFKVNF